MVYFRSVLLSEELTRGQLWLVAESFSDFPHEVFFCSRKGFIFLAQAGFFRFFFAENPFLVLHEYKYLVNTENYAYEAVNATYNALGKGPFVSKKEFTLARDFVNTRVAEAREPYFRLTLTRPIGLPPHTPVAQKIADQR